MKRALLGTIAAVAVAATGLVAAAPAQADWSTTWTRDDTNSYGGGDLVFSNQDTYAALLTSAWETFISGDMKFDAGFANTSVGANGTQTIAPFSPDGTETYGQVITVPSGAGALNSFSFYVTPGSGSGPYSVKALVIPINVGTMTPSGPPVWVGPGFDMALGGGETKVTVVTGGLNLIEGDSYAIVLTTLDVTVATSDESAGQNLIYQAVGNTGKCDASKGYTTSWAEWVNDGKGGATCDRTLLWTDELGWVPASFDAELNRYVPIPDATL